MWHVLVESSGRRTVCIHDFTTKYMTATQAVMAGIEEYWKYRAELIGSIAS